MRAYCVTAGGPISWPARVYPSSTGLRERHRSPRPSAGLSVTTWTSRRHSRCTPLTKKSRLPAPFWAFLIEHSVPFLICLLLEPAVNEGAH
jgi:hypothetical protein